MIDVRDVLDAKVARDECIVPISDGVRVDLLQAKARADGRSMIMSSSQADEPEPQARHRQVGFRDAGVIDDLRPFQVVSEIIFVRTEE